MLRLPCLILLLATFLPAASGNAAPLTVDEIMERAMAPRGGKDMLARLDFLIEAGTERKRFVLLMAYKREGGKPGAGARLIMFNDFPPHARDVSFLARLHPPASGKKDEMWLYLPQLRSIRKLSHRHEHGHHPEKNEDDFALSVLQRFELQPRDPGLDKHVLLEETELDGQPVYRIASTPRDARTSPYARIVFWITHDDHLPVRLDYLDAGRQVVKRQTLRWQRRGDAWVWQEVEATDLLTGHRTRLRLRDVKVNTGLSDNLFSKRFMRRGAGALQARLR